MVPVFWSAKSFRNSSVLCSTAICTDKGCTVVCEEFGKYKTSENGSVSVLEGIPRSCTRKATLTLLDGMLQMTNAFVSDPESTLEGH